MNTFTNWFAISLLVPTIAISGYAVYKKVVYEKVSYIECWNAGSSLLSGVYKGVSSGDGVTEYKMDDGRIVQVYNATCIVTEIPKEKEKVK